MAKNTSNDKRIHPRTKILNWRFRHQQEIRREYPDELGDATKMSVSVISTGSLAIDLALGAGGLPRGRIVEIYGPESSGKTTFCLSVIAKHKEKEGTLFLWASNALDPRYAKIVGVDLDNLMVSQPESGEDALNITETYTLRSHRRHRGRLGCRPRIETGTGRSNG